MNQIISIIPPAIPVFCPNLTDPANGQVTMPSNTPDSAATYTCNTGFMLFGNSMRTCQADGTWTGTEPTCERE